MWITQAPYDAGVVERHYPDASEIFHRMGWAMLEDFDRVYDNSAARATLGLPA